MFALASSLSHMVRVVATPHQMMQATENSKTDRRPVHLPLRLVVIVLPMTWAVGNSVFIGRNIAEQKGFRPDLAPLIPSNEAEEYFAMAARISHFVTVIVAVSIICILSALYCVILQKKNKFFIPMLVEIPIQLLLFYALNIHQGRYLVSIGVIDKGYDWWKLDRLYHNRLPCSMQHHRLLLHTRIGRAERLGIDCTQRQTRRRTKISRGCRIAPRRVGALFWLPCILEK